jgi:hypothetical protein
MDRKRLFKAAILYLCRNAWFRPEDPIGAKIWRRRKEQIDTTTADIQ